jgi:hypothetical protein
VERDLILGYVAVKLTSFLAMALHAQEEPVGMLPIAICIAGFAGGLFLLVQAWRKARALMIEPVPSPASDSPDTNDQPVPITGSSNPIRTAARRPAGPQARQTEPA